jgi:hypothetical protein
MHLKPDNVEFFSFIEGSMLRKHGGQLLALLIPQQMLSRQLTAKEIVEIYKQGKKDPAIISRDCKFGNKAHLLTYHAKNILEMEEYLIPETENPDVSIGAIGGPLSHVYVTISHPHDHIVYISYDIQNITLKDIFITNSYRWIKWSSIHK